jgi:hypothetical protein
LSPPAVTEYVLVLVATLTIFALPVALGLLVAPGLLVPDGLALAPAWGRNPHPAMPSTKTTANSQETFLMRYLGESFRSATSPQAR